MDVSVGSLRRASDASYSWAATAFEGSFYAFRLFFNDINVFSSTDTTRYIGFTVRLCSLSEFLELNIF